MRLRKFHLLALSAIVVSLVVAACGGGSDPTATSGPAAPAPTTAPAPTAVPDAPAPTAVPDAPAPTAAPGPTSALPPTAAPRATAVPAATARPQDTATPVPVPEGEMTIALTDLGESHTWLFSGGTDRKYLDLMYDYMLGATDEVELDTESGLVSEWTISDDAQSYAFKTRDGVTFWDGSRADASDIVRYLEEVRDGEGYQISSVGNLRNDVKEFRFIDINTFEVDINAPTIFWHLQWLSLIGQGGSPNHVVDMDHLSEIGLTAYNRDPSGSGPYKFVSVAPSDNMVMEAQDEHWFFGVPKIKTVIVRAIPEEITRIALVRAGDADLAPIGRASLASARDAGLQIFERPGSVCACFRMEAQYVENYPGYGPNPLNDPKVRVALGHYAIDRQVIADTFMQGLAQPYFDYPSQTMDRTYSAFPPTDYDPARAKELLTAAGYPDGFELDLIVWNPPRSNLPEGPEIMEAIAVWYEDLGLTVKRIPMSFTEFRTRLFAPGKGPAEDGISGGPWERPTIAGAWGLGASPVAGASQAGAFNASGRFNTHNTVSNPELAKIAQEWQSTLTIEAYAAKRIEFMELNIAQGFATGGGTPIVSYGLIWAGNDTIPAEWNSGPSRYAFNYKKIAAGVWG